MKKYISFGEYNALYKHIWWYVLTRIIYDYLLFNLLEKKHYDGIFEFPKDILIQQAFNYLISFIGSIFLYFFEKNQQKENSNNKFLSSEKNQISENEVELIYNGLEDYNTFSKSDYFIIIFLFLSIQLYKVYSILHLKGLDFWMFEILFMAIINFKLFDIPIYKHKKLGIFIIVFFSTIFKIISLIYRFIEKVENKTYTKSYFLIPIGFFSFLLIILLRSYVFCKIKYLCDTKYIYPSKILLLYSFLGAFLCFTASLIPTFIPCTDSSDKTNYYDLYKLICQINVTKVGNSEILYYENYSIYFQKFLKNIISSIIIFIMKTISSFFYKVFTIYTIKTLSPEYIICSNSIYCILTEIVDLIFLGFIENKKEYKNHKIYGLIAEVFGFIGSLIYLELIELRFCLLDYDIKKNIKKRAISEINIGGLDDDELEPTNTFDKNKENDINKRNQELI